jgi:hypothetical protein
MVLADNPSGMSFDIEWLAAMNPHEEAHDFRRSNGRVVQDIGRRAIPRAPALISAATALQVRGVKE